MTRRNECIMNYYYKTPISIIILFEEDNRLVYCLFGQVFIDGNYHNQII